MMKMKNNQKKIFSKSDMKISMKESKRSPKKYHIKRIKVEAKVKARKTILTKMKAKQKQQMSLDKIQVKLFLMDQELR